MAKTMVEAEFAKGQEAPKYIYIYIYILKHPITRFSKSAVRVLRQTQTTWVSNSYRRHKTCVEKKHKMAVKGLELTKTTVWRGVVRVRGRRMVRVKGTILPSLESEAKQQRRYDHVIWCAFWCRLSKVQLVPLVLNLIAIDCITKSA